MSKSADVNRTLWNLVRPLLPVFVPSLLGGPRRAVDDLQALNGILFVLRSGIAWEHLPKDLGYGTGMTCWRRLQAWREAGAWPQVQAVLQAELHAPERFDFSRVEVPWRGPHGASARRPVKNVTSR